MKEMLTFWETDIESLNKEQLKIELRAQKWLLRTLEKQRKIQIYKDQNDVRISNVRMDRIELLNVYIKNLEGFIAAIERQANITPYSRGAKVTKEERQKEGETRKKAYFLERNDRLSMERARTGINLQWDKEKFMLVTRDRGYQTEEAVIYAIQKKLSMSYNKARMLVNTGRFSWGQVLLVGAVFEMTPKEFCDIFMAGYFVEVAGNYQASDENIDYKALLRNGIRPDLIDEAEEGE